jgi:hypothetical protein
MTRFNTHSIQLAIAGVFFALFSLTLAAPVYSVEPAAGDNQESAQEEEENEEEDEKEETPKEEIVSRAAKEEQLNGVVGRTLLFNGDLSTVPQGVEVQYIWNFGDGNEGFGIDATHAYKRSGVYTVTLSIIDGTGEYKTSQDTVTISVQDRVAVLLADQTISEEQVEDLRSFGLTQGVLLVVLRSEGIDQEYQEIQNLVQQINEREEDIASADVLISWTSGNTGLNTFIELARLSEVNNTSIERFGFENKAIVAVNNNQTISAGAKLAQTVYQSINPNYIVVADENILDDALIADEDEQLRQELAQSDAQYQLITEYTERGLEELSPFNFMSYMLNFMINQGVPVNSVFLILMLPVIATIIASARQLVGIKAFGIFAPTVIALSFLVTGIEYGIAIFGIIIVLGTLARLFARRIRLLYLPRMAIVLSLVALAIFGLYFVGSYFDNILIGVSIFPILIMTVLAEHFISVQIDQGYKSAIKLTFETLLLSVAGYFIGDWTVFKTTILAYPELVLLTFVINIIVGKFAGLRLTEYIRFRNVFKQIRNADKSS